MSYLYLLDTNIISELIKNPRGVVFSKIQDVGKDKICTSIIEMEYSFEGFCFMKLEEYFNALAPDDIRLKGTRIGIESILYEYIYRSKTPEEIAEQFHTVTLEQVYATILYYLHHRLEVDAYLVDWLEFSRTIREEQQQNPSPARMRFRRMQEEKAPKQLQES